MEASLKLMGPLLDYFVLGAVHGGEPAMCKATSNLKLFALLGTWYARPEVNVVLEVCTDTFLLCNLGVGLTLSAKKGKEVAQAGVPGAQHRQRGFLALRVSGNYLFGT